METQTKYLLGIFIFEIFVIIGIIYFLVKPKTKKRSNKVDEEIEDELKNNY